MEVHSYELKERRFSKEEFLEANIEIKAKRGFHTLEILDYMNEFLGRHDFNDKIK